MQQEYEGEVQGHPRQVEDGDQALPRQKTADRVDVAHRLYGLGRGGTVARQTHQRPGCERHQALVEARAKTHQHLCANDVKHALEEVEHDHEDRQRDERRDAVTRQNTVVNLEHIKRAGERQNVHDTRNRKRRTKDEAAAAQDFAERPGVTLLGHLLVPRQQFGNGGGDAKRRTDSNCKARPLSRDALQGCYGACLPCLTDGRCHASKNAADQVTNLKSLA